MNRKEQIEKAAREEFDICIIGGGITGAGLLADAVERGWKTILIEKNDFASGTSSRSSKMIHGGVRYLRYLQIKLVREALRERGHILKLFPHLVKPIPFLLPSYRSNLDLISKDLGLSLYDRLAGKSNIPPHIKLNAKQVLEKLPGLKSKNLKGGIYYWDAWTNDARLTIDVLSDGMLKGATVLNYLEVKKFEFESNTVKAITCTDHISNTEIKVKAKVFINATGVWTDDILEKMTGNTSHTMQPSKGIHVVVPSQKLPKECVAIVTSITGEKRFLYTLPWEHGLTILGATDTDFNGSADKVVATKDNVQYMLDTFNSGFPEAHLERKDVISVFAGLRPLLKDEDSTGTYSRSREYQIWWSKDNFISIAGGKLTSFLSMGKRCLEVVAERFKNLSKEDSIASSPSYSGKWKDTYGSFGKYLEEIITENPENTEQFSEKYNYMKAEIIFFTRHQFAEEVADMLTRRTSITYAMKNFDEMLVNDIAQLMAKELHKDNSWIKEQQSKYYEHWLEYHPEFLRTN